MMKSPEAILFIGIQASGKSSFYFAHFANTHVRINLDMLKTRNRERILLNACLEAKQSFVIDNTNPEIADRKRYFELLSNRGYLVSAYYFQSKIEDSISRNAFRKESDTVPEVAIKGTFSKLVLPSYSEGFDKLYYVSIDKQKGFSVSDWNDEI